jgi:hypothetical protein
MLVQFFDILSASASFTLGAVSPYSSIEAGPCPLPLPLYENGRTAFLPDRILNIW